MVPFMVRLCLPLHTWPVLGLAEVIRTVGQLLTVHIKTNVYLLGVDPHDSGRGLLIGHWELNLCLVQEV